MIARAVRGFFEHNDLQRAAALTYLGALSTVPSLAFAFALLKGLGGYQVLVERTIRPYIVQTFQDNPPLEKALEQVLAFVGRTNMASVGAVGLLFLVFSAVSLLANIESALNATWGVSRGRSMVRRFADYIALMVTTPLLLTVAITTLTAAASQRILDFLRYTLGLGALIDLGLRFASAFVVFVGLTLLYLLLPNTPVRRRSAVLGGAVAAVLWQLALVLYVRFQIGVSGYSAMYSGFAAIPVFLFWMYVSWVVVLLGGEIAASEQFQHQMGRGWRVTAVDPALRERLALAAMLRIGHRFTDGGPPWTAASLAETLEVPPEIVIDVMRTLESARLVACEGLGGETAYLPRRDLGRVRAYEVVEAVRHSTPDGRKVEDESLPLGAAGELVRAWETQLAQAPGDVTVAELAARDPAREPPPALDARSAHEEPPRTD